jgi:hypothetical protein
MCRFLPVNLRPINWIEELTSRAYTNWMLWCSVTWYIVLRPVHNQSMSSAFCIMNNVLHGINTFLCLLVVGFR